MVNIREQHGFYEFDDPQKNVKEVLEKLDNYQEELTKILPFNEYKESPPIYVETHIPNKENEIGVKLTKDNSHLKYYLNSITAGLVSCDDFFDLIEYIAKNSLKVKSESESWLTDEVINGLMQIKERIQSNKIVKGMQNSNKSIGRPSNDEQIQLAIKLYKSGNYTGNQITQMTGVSRSTLYRHLRKLTD